MGWSSVLVTGERRLVIKPFRYGKEDKFHPCPSCMDLDLCAPEDSLWLLLLAMFSAGRDTAPLSKRQIFFTFQKVFSVLPQIRQDVNLTPLPAHQKFIWKLPLRRHNTAENNS